jgi:branched-chain amino acid transport system substrate-binding protein
MREPTTALRRTGGLVRRALAVATLSAFLVALTACGDDDDATGGGSGGPDEQDLSELLGPEDAASGDPVKIGMVSDGATAAFDNTDELRAAQATAEFWNEHRGGVGGRPVEVVTCETGADPAGATDCANQLVEEGVVAVTQSQSAVTESLWAPLHDAGVPTFFFQASGSAEMATDVESTFFVFNPLTSLMGLPIAVADSVETDRIDFVLIDVPQAVTGFEMVGPTILENAGYEYDLIRVPAGTADMTSQMQQVVDNGAGVVQVVGNDAFCIAAFQGLAAVDYEGVITTLSQCITNATRDAVGDGLEGMYLQSSLTLGAAEDPTYQLYQAVMQTYGDDVEDVENATAMGGYAAAASLFMALDGISGEITPETAIEAIKAMPEQELPGGGGMTYRCGGTAFAVTPPVCTNQWLQATLDADGQPTDYEVVDSTDILQL